MDLVDAAKNLSLEELADAINFVSLHSAYPGTTGTSEISGGSPAYTREAVAWNAASAGSVQTSAGLTFDVPAASAVSFAGLWSAGTAGTFYGSIPLGPVGDPFLAQAAATADLWTSPGHGLADTQTIVISKTLGALPAGVTDGQVVFVRDVSGDTFKVALTSGGTAIDITTGGRAMLRRITPESFAGQGQYAIASLTLLLA